MVHPSRESCCGNGWMQFDGYMSAHEMGYMALYGSAYRTCVADHVVQFAGVNGGEKEKYFTRL